MYVTIHVRGDVGDVHEFNYEFSMFSLLHLACMQVCEKFRYCNHAALDFT